eukprot:8753870-Pyramimonas_sp.AAC.1
MTANAREVFDSGELRKLKDPISGTSPLHLHLQPDFVGSPPSWHWLIIRPVLVSRPSFKAWGSVQRGCAY